uniref:NADH-ubiquinone oxidoreductase chain 4 n=1 Tax=Archaeocroton sphenodonti TaxID=2599316 RepID=H9M782_9ACAR|nr:NADH dehydrogenase subunit 4 [Archaeocroton sphenodonti]AET63099.1 NADH dehydrogenase subunit 4 [Archaeocroton sphenodonti]
MLGLLTMSFLILCQYFYLNSFQLMVILMFMMIKIILMVSSNSEMVSIFLYVDLMGVLLILLSFWISFLMILASTYNKVFENKNFIFYVMLMLFLLVICFSISNLLGFYFFFESVLFPIIMMIFGWGLQPERLQAGFYMLMYTLFGSIPMLLMILIFKKSSLMFIFMEWEMVKTGFFFIFFLLGFMVKIPVFLFHLWLPKAHVEAPIAGSMILAGVLLKLGIYGIFRFKWFFLYELIWMGWVLMIASIFGSLIVSFICFFQMDIKSLIAYSSVCHMGIVFSGTVNFSFFGSYGSLLLMIGHGLCSSGLFCLANLFYERFFTRSMILIKGMVKIFPTLSLWWFLFSVVNMSAPLTMNLLGELFLSLSILKYSMIFIIPLSLIIFFSACYTIYMYSYLNHGEGWILWSKNNIFMREYLLMFLHLFPLVFWILKFDFFLKWI